MYKAWRPIPELGVEVGDTIVTHPEDGVRLVRRLNVTARTIVEACLVPVDVPQPKPGRAQLRLVD